MASYTNEEIEAAMQGEAEFELTGISGAIRGSGIGVIAVLTAPGHKLVFEADQVRASVGWADTYRIFCKQEKGGRTTIWAEPIVPANQLN